MRDVRHAHTRGEHSRAGGEEAVAKGPTMSAVLSKGRSEGPRGVRFGDTFGGRSQGCGLIWARPALGCSAFLCMVWRAVLDGANLRFLSHPTD